MRLWGVAADDAGDDVGDVGLRIAAIELGGLDQRGQYGPVLGPAIGAGEKGVLAIEGQRPDGPLDGVVVELDAAIIQEQGQARPARQRVADRLGQFGLLTDCLQTGAQPGLQGVD